MGHLALIQPIRNPFNNLCFPKRQDIHCPTPGSTHIHMLPHLIPRSLAGRVLPSPANPLGVYDAGTALWAQGKGKQEPPEDQSQTTAEDQRVASLSEKTGDFNRRLREEPGDTQLWMDFIRYQVRAAYICI